MAARSIGADAPGIAAPDAAERAHKYQAPGVTAEGLQGKGKADTANCADVPRAGQALRVLEGVEPARRAGVAQDLIVTHRRQHEREHRRSSALTARDGLIALEVEARIVWHCAATLRHGASLTDEDFDRLTVAARSIDYVCREVVR